MPTPLSFKQFLSIVNEDASSDIAKIQADIATIDAAINQKTSPLLMQRQRLQKMLVVKQKQKEAEDVRTQQQQAAKSKEQATQTPPMQAGQTASQGPNV
jgi:hypothetical protein